MSKEPTRLRDLVHADDETVSTLSELEHEVAEAAITWFTCDVVEATTGNTEELDKAGELLAEAIVKLIKFKEEAKS